MLKKLFRGTLIIILLFVTAHTIPSVAAKTKHSEESAYLWANELSRKPGDPPYLSLYYRFRTTYFSLEGASKNPIVFLGDSITDEGNWNNLFPSVAPENRGIGGDTTLGVLNRLDQIIALKPCKIFLMIGTNDLCFGRPIPEIIDNYQKILLRLKHELPHTNVYIQSVLPMNTDLFPERNLRNNENITTLNQKISQLAAEVNDDYIDLTPSFTDSYGKLPRHYTRDGLHLNDAGYVAWRNQIVELVIDNKE